MREWVALGALVVAAVIAGFYLRPDPAGTDVEPQPTRPATPRPTSAPTARPTPPPPSPTPTPVPVPLAKEAAAEWTVVFYRIMPDGREVEAASAKVATLDIDIPGAPFGDVPDGQWKVSAFARLTATPGYYQARIAYRGAITVTVNDVEVATATGEGQLRPAFPIEAATKILIEVRDGDGPTRLRWE